MAYNEKKVYKRNENKSTKPRYKGKEVASESGNPKFRGSERTFEKKEKKSHKKFDNKKFDNDRESEFNYDDEIAPLQLEGRNAVLSAINSGKAIDKIYFKKGEVEGTLKVIRAKALEKNIVCVETRKESLEQMSKTHNNQGVIAICPAKEYVEVDDILQYAKDKGEKPFIIILDGITDTYNLGAILRSAQVFGVHGVILPKRRSATLNAGVSKASAGAINFVNVARVTNITREIEKLQEKGVWVVSTDFDGQNVSEIDMDMPLAVVIGSEGEGISRIVKEKSDFVAKVPQINDEIGSLNASVATGVLLYEVVRQRLGL